MGKAVKIVAGILLCVVALVFAVNASKEVNTYRYNYNKGQILYYELQARNMRLMAYGLFASDYRYLASQWDEMADDAREYISAQDKKAATWIGMGAGSFVLGVVLLVSGLKRKPDVVFPREIPEIQENTLT